MFCNCCDTGCHWLSLSLAVTVTVTVAVAVAVAVTVAARLPADCRSCISLCCRWLGSRTMHTPPRLESVHRRTAAPAACETADHNMHGARCPSVAGPTAASIGDDLLVMLTTAVRRSDAPIRAPCGFRIFAGGLTDSVSVFLCGLS